MSEIYSMTILNRTGDITITWDDHEDKDMKDMIDQKIKQGYTFFIIKGNTISDELKLRKKIGSSKDIGSLRKVILDDESAERLFKNDKIGVHNMGNTQSKIETRGVAKTSEEVLKNNTVATRRMQGG